MEEELGVPWEDVFESHRAGAARRRDDRPGARATLESGERVVVKVQRPRRARGRSCATSACSSCSREGREPARLPQARRHPGRDPTPVGLAPPGARLPPGGGEHRPPERGARAATRGSTCRRSTASSSTSRLLVLELIHGVPVRDAPDVPEREGGRPPADRVVLPADPGRRLLPRRPASGQPAVVGRTRSTSSTSGWSASSTPEVREQLMLLLMAFWQDDDEFLAEVVLMLAGERQLAGHRRSTRSRTRSAQLFAGVPAQSLHEIQLGPILQGITRDRRPPRRPAPGRRWR